MHLVTWNTQWCRGLDGAVSPRRIVEGARAMADFDVLCLQEIAQGFDCMPGTPGDQPAELAALLPGFRLFFGAAVDTFDDDGQRMRFGNVVATRLPVANVQHHPLPWPADGSTPSMPRMCTVVTVRDPDLGPLRIMTTHLEYYAEPQRLAQARALRALHDVACAQAASPPKPAGWNSPFRGRPHTVDAILCGDFNMDARSAAYAALLEPLGTGSAAASAGAAQGGNAPSALRDAWPLVHGSAAQPPTFMVFDRTHGPEPIACDFVFVSEGLGKRVDTIEIDGKTQASDHQPVHIALR